MATNIFPSAVNEAGDVSRSSLRSRGVVPDKLIVRSAVPFGKSQTLTDCDPAIESARPSSLNAAPVIGAAIT
ncbi:MAG: hypothetical protein AAB401_04280, partial [Acidobacteriota bacterium]